MHQLCDDQPVIGRAVISGTDVSQPNEDTLITLCNLIAHSILLIELQIVAR